MTLNKVNKARKLNGTAILALLSGSALILPTVALAQAQTTAAPTSQAPAAADTTVVVVTGSHVKRKDASTVGELLTLNSADIEHASVGAVGDLVQQLPSAGVSYNRNGSQGTSYGGSSISLRYLADSDGDANRTLVLVDGHRWVDGVGARGIRDFVDLNTMPVGMVSNIEVLQDGASAIYGADAIAGVVNIHTPTNYEGLESESKYGVSSHGDGTEAEEVLKYGHKFKWGSLFISGSYVKDGPVLTADRGLTQVSLTAGLANLATPGSSPRGLYILPGFSTSASPLTQNVGITMATGLSSYHTASLPGDYYNTDAQGVDAVSPSERKGLYAKLTFDLPDGMKWTVDALYNERRSTQLYSPSNLSIGGTLGTYKGFSIAANQPYNPFGVAFAANQPWNIQIFTPAAGDREQKELVQTGRISSTLSGSFNFMKHDWDWSVFGSAAEDHMTFNEDGFIDLEHVELALSSPSVCAAAPGCVPLNIFGQMTPTQAAYINNNAHETNSTWLYDSTADITGTLVDLPYGPLSVAAGGEIRDVRGRDYPDSYVNELSTDSGVLPLPVSDPTTTQPTRTPTADGLYQVREAYVELNAPLLADLPFVKRLELDVASRYSDYSTGSSKVTSKAGFGYRPVDGLLLRGTWSQGFRAPSLIELYTGNRQTNLAGTNTDPCDGGAAAHPNLPGCAGISSSYNQNLYNGGLVPETISGNPNLKPETAETWSYGLALTPTFMRGWSYTIDAYRIAIHDAISTPSASAALDLCADYAGAYCSVVSRDPSTGQILNFTSSYENLNEIKTSGFDTTLRYHGVSGVGAWDAMLSGTYLNNFDTYEPNPTGGPEIVIHAAGTSTGGTYPATARSTYPHWKGLATLRWSHDDLGAMVRLRYIGSTTDGAAPALPVVPVKGSEVPSITYTDLELDKHLDRSDVDITVGVNDLFGTMPPASYANAPINFDIYTYDVVGRYFYVKVNKKF